MNLAGRQDGCITARTTLFFFFLVTFVHTSGRKKSDKVICSGHTFGGGPIHGLIFYTDEVAVFGLKTFLS